MKLQISVDYERLSRGFRTEGTRTYNFAPAGFGFIHVYLRFPFMFFLAFLAALAVRICLIGVYRRSSAA
jgi:hypothetical protein